MLKVINSVFKYLKQRSAYNQTYRELAKLSDRELSDIGISRYDISAIAAETTADNNPVTYQDSLSALKILFNSRVVCR